MNSHVGFVLFSTVQRFGVCDHKKSIEVTKKSNFEINTHVKMKFASTNSFDVFIAKCKVWSIRFSINRLT